MCSSTSSTPRKARCLTSWSACVTTEWPATASWPPGWWSWVCPVTYDEVVAEASAEERVGRPHFGAVLTRNGATTSVADAFRQVAGCRSPGPRPQGTGHPCRGRGPGSGFGRGSGACPPPVPRPRPRRPLLGGRRAGRSGLRRDRSGSTGATPRPSGPRSARSPAVMIWCRLVVPTTTERPSRTSPSGRGPGDLKVPDDVLSRLEAAPTVAPRSVAPLRGRRRSF